MSAIWDHAPYEAGTLLVLLALADYANDEGECWPNVCSIARKVRLGTRQVHNILRDLKNDGVISFQKGGGRGVTNRYQVHPETLKSISVNPVSLKPISLKSATETLQSSSRNSDICDNAIRKNRHESPKEPSRGTRIPEGFTPAEKHRVKARELGLNVDAECEAFLDHFRAKSGRDAIKCDWNCAFNNWLRRAPEFGGHRSGNSTDRSQSDVIRDASERLARETA